VGKNQKCSPARFVVKYKQIAVRAYSLTANDDISIPVGTVTAVKEYMNKLGLGRSFRRSRRRANRFLLLLTLLSAIV